MVMPTVSIEMEFLVIVTLETTRGYGRFLLTGDQ